MKNSAGTLKNLIIVITTAPKESSYYPFGSTVAVEMLNAILHSIYFYPVPGDYIVTVVHIRRFSLQDSAQPSSSY